jgi:hypothetical protein
MRERIAADPSQAQAPVLAEETAPVIIGQFQKDDQLEKRRREQTRKQKQLYKQQRRVKRAAERQMHPGPAVDKDADLAGIIPGPQPGQII